MVPVHQISVFATEAMRTAQNKDELLEAIKSSSGLVVEILSPDMESLFGAMGARSGFHQVDGLFMDLGGGSVQMTYVNSKSSSYDVLAAKAAQSMPYGAAKLTAALNSQDQPFSQQHLQVAMKKTFNDLKSRFAQLKSEAKSSNGITIYLYGGGFRGYGSMLMHTHEIQPYPIPVIGGFTVSGAKFVQWQDMLKANEQQGKIFGMSKRRRSQLPAIVMVVEALVNAIPHIKQAVFCSGSNREGVLYMKLPSTIRESSPLPLLTGSSELRSTESVDAIVKIFSKALPDASPPIFSPDLQRCFVQNTWIDMGDSDDLNSVKALRNPISGTIAGMPGLTHEIKAILALTLCARWGTNIGPMDKVLFKNLRQLVGPNLSFWCEYLGAVARLLATILPAFPSDEQVLKKTISFVFLQSCQFLCSTQLTKTSFQSSSSKTLGKSGKKSGIKLTIGVPMDARKGIELEDLLESLMAVGKGLDIDQRVQAELADL
jgi:retrograde regulation protein 2